MSPGVDDPRLVSVSRVRIRLLSGLLHIILGSAVGSSPIEAQNVAWRPIERWGADVPAAESSENPAPSISPALLGAIVGGAGGGLAGLLFAHESCNEDPCSSGAYVLSGVGGAALLGAMGAVIGTHARGTRTARRSAWTGTAVGAVAGATAGIVLVAVSCGGQSCGPAGYVSVAMFGGGVLGAAGAAIGSRVGRVGRALDVGGQSAVPILGLSASGMLVGARIPV